MKKRAGRIAGQGSNWLWRPTRLRIYARDRHTCVYCGRDVKGDGVTLSVDHVIPVGAGGDNRAENLITCCVPCNSAKRTMTLGSFLAYLAGADYPRRARKTIRATARKAIRAAVRRQLPSKLERWMQTYSGRR